MGAGAVAKRDTEEPACSNTKKLSEECDDIGNDVERVWLIEDNTEVGDKIFTVRRKT